MIISIAESQESPMQSDSLLQPLDQALTKVFICHPHLSKRKVHFLAEANGRVVLQGSVQTYFEKQLAQEAVRNVDGVEQIDNQLAVEPN
ncbi:MAG: BON domain-containing protein [Pirellulaceae bacterium]